MLRQSSQNGTASPPNVILYVSITIALVCFRVLVAPERIGTSTPWVSNLIIYGPGTGCLASRSSTVTTGQGRYFSFQACVDSCPTSGSDPSKYPFPVVPPTAVKANCQFLFSWHTLLRSGRWTWFASTKRWCRSGKCRAKTFDQYPRAAPTSINEAISRLWFSKRLRAGSKSGEFLSSSSDLPIG